MSLLREYCNDHYNISYSDFDKLSLDDRYGLSKTWGYERHLACIELAIAWERFADSLFDSIDNKFYKWLLKTWFKIKGIT